jgi:hypothetical protein
MRKEINYQTEKKQWTLYGVMYRFISYLTMKKVRYFTSSLSGTVNVYVDCYGQKWLAYSDFPKKRCTYNGA